MTSSVLIRGGTVFDGATRGGVVTDLRLEGGVITALGDDLAREGETVVDATGAWVTPGFIDAHSHCDLAVLSGSAMEVRARAGVTTEIVGQDGLGYAPVTTQAAEIMVDVLDPITGEVPSQEWVSVGDYLDAVDAGSFARVATLVPHGALRAAVMGREGRPATAAEQEIMARTVAAEMRRGAVGLSTGLSYPPALWSDTDELVRVAAAMPIDRGSYVTHLRDYGERFDDALEEAFAVGARSGRPVHLSHFHVSGLGRAGRAGRYLDRLAAADVAGIKVTSDSYPYLMACTFLSTVLPPSLQRIDRDAMLGRLEDAGQRDELADTLERHGPGATVAVGWDKIFLAGLAGTALEKWEGRTIAEIADERRTTRGHVAVEALRQLEGQGCILVDQGHRDNVITLAARTGNVAGSDGIPGSGVPHPRAAGTFLRLLRWARDGVTGLSVGEAVARMTIDTARIFGLPVGRLAVGAPADVLVIDPDALVDGPEVGAFYPDAVRHSYLAGEAVIQDGRWLAPTPRGMSLRPGADR